MSERDRTPVESGDARKSAATLWIVYALGLSAASLVVGIELVTGGEPEPAQPQQSFDMASAGLRELVVVGGLALGCWGRALSKFSRWGTLIWPVSLIVVAGALSWAQVSSLSGSELDLWLCGTAIGACQ